MTDWWSRARARTAGGDEEGDPSISQRLARVEAHQRQQRVWMRWGLRALVGVVTLGLGGAGAYYREWKAAKEQAAVDRYRLAAVEKDNDTLRSALFGLLPYVRNVPAPPASGDPP